MIKTILFLTISLLIPQGSHLSQFDDQKTYFEGVINFIREVDGIK
jgi:hypothetical protein